MYYAAVVTAANDDGTFAVSFRDLKKIINNLQPDWCFPRDPADNRPVIVPLEIAAQRSPVARTGTAQAHTLDDH
jgi:hypothetical protein